MPYNSETETFYQAPATVVDSTPDGDTVQEGFDDRLTPALTALYDDLNLLKADGMISVGIPATTTARGIGRVATSADLVDGATISNGPAFLAAGTHTSVAAVAGKIPVADGSGKIDSWVSLSGKLNTDYSNLDTSKANVLLQRASYVTSAVATATSPAMPNDDTIPQITEGTQFLSLTVTPKSATSVLEIEVQLQYSQTTSTNFIAALFDGNIYAIAASSFSLPAGFMGSAIIKHVVPAESVSPRTYTVRAAADNGGTFTVNGVGGGRKFGGKMYSHITVKEYAA